MAVQLAEALGTYADQPLPIETGKGKAGHATEQDNRLSVARSPRRIECCPGGGYLVFRNAAGIHKDDPAVLNLSCDVITIDQKKLHGLREKEGARLTPLACIENEDRAPADGLWGQRIIHGVGATEA